MGWMSFPQSVNPKSAIDNPKMNLREIAAGAMICVSFAVCAKGNITGTVSNKGTGEPMDFVTVQIFDAASGTPLQISASTDENGHFTLKGVPDGNYVVKVINVGSVNQERNVGVKGSDIDLGNIRLADDAKLLKEVVVEGIRSQMRFELDRKVFQVDANIAGQRTAGVDPVGGGGPGRRGVATRKFLSHCMDQWKGLRPYCRQPRADSGADSGREY